MPAFKVKPILLQKTESRQVDDLQRGLSEPIRQLQGLPQMQGRYISQLTDATGLTGPIHFDTFTIRSIRHQLGRPFVGWIACRMRNVVIVVPGAVPVLFEDTQAAEFNATQVTFTNITGASFDVDFWVY